MPEPPAGLAAGQLRTGRNAGAIAGDLAPEFGYDSRLQTGR
jgi:hypothetical protein